MLSNPNSIDSGKRGPGELNSRALFWWLHSAGWVGVFLVGYLSALAYGKSYELWKLLAPVAITGFLGTLGLRYLLRALSGVPPVRVALLMIGPVLAVSAAMGLTYAVILLNGWCGGCRVPSSWLGYAAYMGSQTYMVVGWVSLYLVITTWRKLRAQTEAALAATSMAHQAQLKMLQYQLNPHFLFNALNAISTLVLDRDPANANRMVQRLSMFLRHSLDADPMQQVTLKQEIDTTCLYLDIEKVRFTERLTVRIEIDDTCWPALLPSLLLQPLVENAIKHAVARRVEGTTLIVRAERDRHSLRLSVLDDGPGRPPPEAGRSQLEHATHGNGVGLANTRERLRMLYGARQSFEARDRSEGGFMVVMTLPFEVGGTAGG
ncbi:sensor histidine kinase [Luteibacter sp. Lutesp34]|uniref:sensor histidine kinase n=1 Tax=Luteibacter sp. Lutesp34 TaxID=3243030 RepID=UPI0039B40FB1